MKKLIVLLTCIMLMTNAAYASGTSDSIEIVKMLGIMTGDPQGNMNLDKNVTRAEFAKMAVYASPFKDSVAKTSYISLYSDLKNTHWASGYVKIGVDNKWYTGYVDGTFRPNNSIKLEEGAAILLRMLGYTSDKLTGVYPNAHLTKMSELGLNKGITASKGQYLTRRECAVMFHNLLKAKNIESAVYGESIGVPMKNDDVDYLALVYKEMEGPFVYNGTLNNNGAKIYKNGREVYGLNNYDVYYYNKGINKVFAFDEKIVGTVTKIEPNKISPESIEIDGAPYNLGNNDVRMEFSLLGKYVVGDKVTLLTGLGKGIVGTIGDKDITFDYIGIVSDITEESRTLNNKTQIIKKVTLLCIDGVERSFYTEEVMAKVGKLAKVNVNTNEVSIEPLYESTLSGKVYKDKIGDNTLSKSVRIVEMHEGKVKQISLEKLDSATLRTSDVLYYEKDKSSDISLLVLNNISGDLMTYGYLYETDTVDEDFYLSGSYNYLVNSEERNLTLSDSLINVDIGGVVETYSGGNKLLKSLEKAEISSLHGYRAVADGRDFDVASDVQVYVKSGDKMYNQVTLDTIREGEFKLVGYYDSSRLGGKIRIILAQK